MQTESITWLQYLLFLFLRGPCLLRRDRQQSDALAFKSPVPTDSPPWDLLEYTPICLSSSLLPWTRPSSLFPWGIEKLTGPSFMLCITNFQHWAWCIVGMQHMLNEWMTITDIYLVVPVCQVNIDSDFFLLSSTNAEFILFPRSKKPFLEIFWLSDQIWRNINHGGNLP